MWESLVLNNPYSYPKPKANLPLPNPPRKKYCSRNPYSTPTLGRSPKTNVDSLKALSLSQL